MDGLLLLGVVLVSVGLLFKVGAVPFHSWTPDVYQGAPTPVTGFMAACTKVAAFGAMLRLFYVGVAGSRWDWQPVLWAVAILTMVVGSVLAITQTDVKRMLAYSSITHAGLHPRRRAGLRPGRRLLGAVLPGRLRLRDIGAFAVVTLVRDGGVRGDAPVAVGRPGQAQPRRRRLHGVPAAGLRGHPADVRLHRQVRGVRGGGRARRLPGWWWSASWPARSPRSSTSGSSCSCTSPSRPARPPDVVAPSVVTTLALTIGTVATLVLGVVPAPVLDLATTSSLFLR